MANCASQPGPTRVSGQAMIAALLMRMSTLRPRSSTCGAGEDAVEVAEVELVDLDALDAGEHLRGVLPAARRDDHVGARAAERAHGLEPEAGVAAGHDREPAGEVDALQDLGRRAAGAEAGVDGCWGVAMPPA